MFNFPWSNFHELNLDWILSVVKEAKEVFDNGRADIDYAVDTADEAKTIATQAAEATIPDNSVSTIKIQNGAITHAKLANNSVTTDNIVDRTITGTDIAENTITNYNIQNGTLIGADLADGTITATQIANNTISKDKLSTELQSFLTPVIGALTETYGDLFTQTYTKNVAKSGGMKYLTLSCVYNPETTKTANTWIDAFTIPTGFESVLSTSSAEGFFTVWTNDWDRPIMDARVVGNKVQVNIRKTATVVRVCDIQLSYI